MFEDAKIRLLIDLKNLDENFIAIDIDKNNSGRKRTKMKHESNKRSRNTIKLYIYLSRYFLYS